jgi:2',3'-cyclic-nucleotide 2'-phosphodiesterase/3'-nucleotidase
MPANFELPALSRRSLLGGLGATAALVLLHPFAARAAGNQAHLRLMETTDIHVNVFPYDYYADKPNDTSLTASARKRPIRC